MPSPLKQEIGLLELLCEGHLDLYAVGGVCVLAADEDDDLGLRDPPARFSRPPAVDGGRQRAVDYFMWRVATSLRQEAAAQLIVVVEIEAQIDASACHAGMAGQLMPVDRELVADLQRSARTPARCTP